MVLLIQRALRPTNFLLEIQKLKIFEKTSLFLCFLAFITPFQLSVGYVIMFQCQFASMKVYIYDLFISIIGAAKVLS